MIFPGSYEIMTFPQNLSLLIATFQETPLSITFLAALFAGVFLGGGESILTLIIHLSFLFPQYLHLTSFCCPLALPFFTLHHLTKYVQDTNTHLEIACNSEKQELRYITALVFHISYQKGGVKERRN